MKRITPETIRDQAIAKARAHYAPILEAARKSGDFGAWSRALNECQWAIDDANKEYRRATYRVAA